MKNLKAALLVLFIMVASATYASGGKSCEEKMKNKDIFTQEQIQMKLDHCAELQPKREALKATFTAEQKAIKKDKTLGRKEKRAKLHATFTAEQKVIHNEIKALRKAHKTAFKSTLTPEQKQQLKTRRKAHKRH